MNLSTYTFHVHGMHCQACVVLTESELSEDPRVKKATSNLQKRMVEVAGDFGDLTPEQIAAELSVPLKPHGYTLATTPEKTSVAWSEFRIAVPLALGFIFFFLFLQKLGIVNLITSSQVGVGTAFVIGLIASVSTCMAVVGGLVLSMSANFAKDGDRVRPQLLFHVGRLASFFLLGGVIGALGSAFQLGSAGVFILSLLVAVVLLILGINLLDIFPWAKKIQVTMPKSIGKRVQSLKHVNHTLTPFLVGIATFFMPCGFTQSMQLYTLTTGSFWTGAGIMLSFALGTLPVLGFLSFSSLGIGKKAQSGTFFKTAGLVVIFFGVFNLLSALAAAGIVPPLFNF